MTSAISSLPRNIGCRFASSFEPKDQPLKPEDLTEAYVEEGVMIDSGSFSGLDNVEGQGKDRSLY